MENVASKAKTEYHEFVGKFGYLLGREWKPDMLLNDILRYDKRVGYTTDGEDIVESTLIDIDYKSLCITFYDDKGKCELSSWVEVWDDDGYNVVGHLNGGKFVPMPN